MDMAHTRNNEYIWSYVVVSDLNQIFEPMSTYNRYTRYRYTVERHDKLETSAGVFGNVHMDGS